MGDSATPVSPPSLLASTWMVAIGAAGAPLATRSTRPLRRSPATACGLVGSPGSEATLVALRKKNGDVLWKCALPEGDQAAYASAIVVQVGGVKQYVQLLQKGLVGVDAKSGKLLWRYNKPVSRYGANIPTPVASDGYIYCAAAGTGGGAVKLKVKEGGVEADEVYFTPKLTTAIGGAVKVGDYLYGTTAQALQCIEFVTGQDRLRSIKVAAAREHRETLQRKAFRDGKQVIGPVDHVA